MTIYGDSWLIIRKKGIDSHCSSIISQIPKGYKPGDVLTIKKPRISIWDDSIHVFSAVIPENIYSEEFICVKTPYQRYIKEYEDYYFEQLKRG